MELKGTWKVSYNPTVDRYIVFRLRDICKTDHSGNREYGSDYIENKKEAQIIADKMNEKEGFKIKGSENNDKKDI